MLDLIWNSITGVITAIVLFAKLAYVHVEADRPVIKWYLFMNKVLDVLFVLLFIKAMLLKNTVEAGCWGICVGIVISAYIRSFLDGDDDNDDDEPWPGDEPDGGLSVKVQKQLREILNRELVIK